MPDILIRGMDKPFHCFACNLSYLRGERLFCPVTKDEVLRFKIASDCPIQELPEHGDLIERDDLYKIMETYTDYGGATEPHDENQIHRDSILFAIENAPVIVPSNKEETE